MDSVLLVHESEIDKMSEFDLNEVLSQFIAEVRKDRGERYPGKTLHELISSLQKYLELNGRSVNFFSNLEFEKLRKSLDPECLLRTVFYLIGLNFGMRAGSEYRVLNINNFSFEKDDTGKEYLLYSEGVSKTYQGGLKHRKLNPRTCKAYANVECADKCIVSIVKLYISRCPEESLRKAFYLSIL